MSRPNSFKNTTKENDLITNIISLLKEKNLNPSKKKDLKYLLSLTVNPDIKKINLEYLLIFLLKYLSPENESLFYENFFQSCELGKLHNVKILLENGFDVNCQNELGETPLHIAIAKNDIELIKLLIKYEPDISITNYKDRFNAMNYAEICGNKDIIEIIKELYEKNKKQEIKNEIVEYINNDMNNLNENLKNYLIKDSGSFMLSRNNTTNNLDQIQNYNGEIVSMLLDEDKSMSSASNNFNKNIQSSKKVINNESKYVNTQTIINESDFYEENSPMDAKNLVLINNNSSQRKNSIKNSKQISTEKKLFITSLKRKEENTFNNNRYSINPSYVQSLTTCHTLNRDHFESNSPMINNKKIDKNKKKESIFKFIQEINLPKEYANNLIDNGFDVLDVLISQTKKGIALSYQNLKDIGVKLPGERAKILVHLEEISGNFNCNIDKEILYANKIDIKNNSLYKFLFRINCEKYINDFIDAGYYNSELLFLQMASRQPLNVDILIEDIGLDKNDAKKILDNLVEGSKNFIEDIKYIEENKEKKSKFIILEENNFKSCDMCLIF
jgi:ankyrin repeat protein